MYCWWNCWLLQTLLFLGEIFLLFDSTLILFLLFLWTPSCACVLCLHHVLCDKLMCIFYLHRGVDQAAGELDRFAHRAAREVDRAHIEHTAKTIVGAEEDLLTPAIRALGHDLAEVCITNCRLCIFCPFWTTKPNVSVRANKKWCLANYRQIIYRIICHSICVYVMCASVFLYRRSPYRQLKCV